MLLGEILLFSKVFYVLPKCKKSKQSLFCSCPFFSPRSLIQRIIPSPEKDTFPPILLAFKGQTLPILKQTTGFITTGDNYH